MGFLPAFQPGVSLSPYTIKRVEKEKEQRRRYESDLLFLRGHQNFEIRGLLESLSPKILEIKSFMYE